MDTPEAVVAAFQEAWNAHDMTALESLFRDKADFVNVHGMWWRDRATIAQRHRAAHAGPYARSALEGELRSLETLAPDIALAHVDWRMHVSDPDAPAEAA
ncbi:MAG TPA: SgcJ/EcaC family oxidoreductase, partial [Kiloniellaceae bacterium]|nr:SgcJ/EcaC family oxidoreductase [Kiloniellaceae bacterium]